jgi:hypothetical protein
MPIDDPDRPSKTAREAPRPQRHDQRHDPLSEQERHLINMGELASSITTAPSGPIDYAPPARRMEKLAEIASRLTTAPAGPNPPPARRMETPGELVVRTVESFSALPTTELDEMIRAVKGEIAQLETEAAEIRSIYVTQTDRLAASIKRLAAGCELAKETLAKLREQCAALPEMPAQKRPDQGGRAEDKGA